MSTPGSNWGAADEQPKPAIDDESWAGKGNTTEPNYDGWGTLAEHPNQVASKRGWKAVFSRKSSYNVKNEAYCMTCKKPFSSTTQLGKHACEAEDGNIMSIADENTMPTGNSSDKIHSDKPNDKEDGETTANGWGDAENNVKTAGDHSRRGIWSAAEDNASHQDKVPDEKGVDDGQCGDDEYEEHSDQDMHLAPTPAWKNRPKRNVHTSPYKERFEALVDQGWLTPSEIELLYTCEGRDLITHLRHFELVAPIRNTENLHPEGLETQIVACEYPYKAVHVLLLQWEEDDLGVFHVMYKLMAVFKTLLGFESVEFFSIPSKRSYEALETRLQGFKQKYSFEKNLLIVYYAGHGYLDARNRMHWAAQRILPCPTLDWYALQVGLERTVSDVLILLDACCSAGASNHVNPFGPVTGGRTEMIVASGFDQATSGLSFTAALIGELKRMAKADPNYDVCISAVQLHQRLLASMLHQSLPKEDPGVMITSIHRFSTPVYISLSRDHHQPSIPLKRFRVCPPPPPSPGSSINNPPRASWGHRLAEDRGGDKATDNHDSDEKDPEDGNFDKLWRLGTPPSAIFSERWNPRSGKMELEAAEELPITESMRTWLLESEELTSTERKKIKDEPVISAFTFHLVRVMIEGRRRLARQSDDMQSLSSNMA